MLLFAFFGHLHQPSGSHGVLWRAVSCPHCTHSPICPHSLYALDHSTARSECIDNGNATVIKGPTHSADCAVTSMRQVLF